MSSQHVDSYGHLAGLAGATALAGAAVGVVTAGSIAGTTSAGAAPTVTAVSAIDQAGQFTLTPVTGGGAQAAGTTSTIRFAQSFSEPPLFVHVQILDLNTAAAPANIPAYAVNITSAGFDIETAALTTAHPYLVQYRVQSGQ